jgi:hypothetical protein
MIQCKVQWRAKLYMHGGSSSFMTHKLTDKEEGPGSNWSWVIWCSGTHSPHVWWWFLVWSTRASEAFGNRYSNSKERGKENPRSISSVIMLSRVLWCILVDLWFPYCEWNSRSSFCRASEIGWRGKESPWKMMFDRWGQCGWNCNKGWRTSTSLNLEPKETWVFGGAVKASEMA